MTEDVSKPEEIISDWPGVVRKTWLDEMPADDAFVENADPHYKGKFTPEERKQLQKHGKSALEVRDVSYPSVLRVVYVRDELEDQVEDTIQVFAAVYDDGRKKDRIHYWRGETKEVALSGEEAPTDLAPRNRQVLQERDDVELQHLGSFSEYREAADDYEYNFVSHSAVPNELMDAVGPQVLDSIKERASA